jgi:phosphomannomutase/phosphoglucomutase
MFREYDIRGLADTDLTDDVVRRIGQAYGTYVRQHGLTQAMVARDVRLSSPRINQALSDGILAAGCDVLELGMIPTPVFYYSFFLYEQSAGMMITASHNPEQFNGFKVGLNQTTIFGEEIQRFRELVESGKFLTGIGRRASADPIPDYINMLGERVQFKSRLKVVFDPGNGTAGVLLEQLLKLFPVDATFINLKPDGRFPSHLPDPTIPEHMKDVTRLVREQGADFGIGYDGDSDRIGVIDDTGAMIYGDRLLGIFAEEIVARKPGTTVVFEVKCSKGLVEHLERIGARPLMWKTGHSLIKARMKEEHAEIAGEMSGHMFFHDGYLGYDDAIFASLRLMKLVAESGQRLSQIASRIPYYPVTPEIRVDCPDELKFDVVKALREHFAAQGRVIDIDGVRAVFPDGWGLARASNTQPVLVLRFEADTESRLAEIRELFYAELRRYPQVRLPPS